MRDGSGTNSMDDFMEEKGVNAIPDEIVEGAPLNDTPMMTEKDSTQQMLI